MIRRWVALWDERERPEALACVRILLGAALLADLFQLGTLGLVDALFVPHQEGGLAMGRVPLPGLSAVAAGRVHYAAMAVAAAALMVGAFTRGAALAWCVLSVGFASILPLGDRGIDLLVRNVVWILVFADAGAWGSVDAWWRRRRGSPPRADVGAWARRLIVVQLVVMYTSAGMHKYAQHWWPWGDYGALWLIWNEWAVSRLAGQPALASEGVWRLSQVATAVTMAWEWTFPGVLGIAWLRRRWPDLPITRFCRTWRLHLAWPVLGLVFHLGIAATLKLGIFPWAMMALYPAFLRPDDVQAVKDRMHRFGSTNGREGAA